MEQTSKSGITTVADDPKKEKSTHITIKVQREREHDIVFRIKRDAPLGRLMRAYCDRLNLQYGVTRFLFEGTRVKELQTAHELEMEDGDCIDAMNDQLGGSEISLKF